MTSSREKTNSTKSSMRGTGADESFYGDDANILLLSRHRMSRAGLKLGESSLSNISGDTLLQGRKRGRKRVSEAASILVKMSICHFLITSPLK